LSVALATTPTGDALAAAADALGAAGVETPRLDSELLLAEATGRDRALLAAEPEAPIEPGAARVFAEMVRRRLRREPVAYIVGRKGFRELELSVDRRALIPRPETELLVDVTLELGPATVLDVGTGCGSVALAIASELPRAEVAATDTSPEALELARENAARLGLADRVRFEGASVPRRRFDLVVANLPYVREGEWERLEPEITRFEPRAALVAGVDGLEAITALVDAGPACDAIALEVGEGQAAPVAELVRDAGFGSVVLRRDLAGIDRVVLGRRR
jgi:release factor glutamine methyltransferase